MYFLNSALLLTTTSSEGYILKDITNVPLHSLFNDYKHVYLNLGHTSNPEGTYGLDMELLRYQLQHLDITVPVWLSTLGSQALSVDTPAKKLVKGYLRYQDARQNGYQLKLASSLEQIADNNWDGKDSLVLTKPGSSPALFVNRSLITLNGMIHYSKYTEFGIMIDGAKNTLDHGCSDIAGILDFSNVCNINQTRINTDTLVRDGNDNKLGTCLQIEVGEENIGKSFGLVFLGRLIIGKPYVMKTGLSTVTFYLEKLPLLRLFQEAAKRIDLSSLPLDIKSNSLATVSVEELTSDVVIKAILNLPQSFLVTLDCPSVYQDFSLLHYTNLSKRYFSAEWVIEPVINDIGLVMEYHQIHEHGYNALIVSDDRSSLYNFDTTNQVPEVISSTRQPGTGDKKSQARKWRLFTANLV